MVRAWPKSDFYWAGPSCDTNTLRSISAIDMLTIAYNL